jgi:hypothetical protein
MARIVMKCPEDLRPHALNKELYGPPTANSVYKDIKVTMGRGGYDERHPLLITEDGRILWGVTRWAVAKSLGLKEVPCIVFRPTNPATAELEAEAEIIRGNIYRNKSQLMIAREQRKLREVESDLARQRMSAGSDGGPSKSTDRVGKIFGESGKTVERRLKVLEAIEEAEAEHDSKGAKRLTDLLEGKKLVKALDVIKGESGKPKPVKKVETPRTLNDHASRAYSEFDEACGKVIVAAELEILEATLQRMRDASEAARQRLEKFT